MPEVSIKKLIAPGSAFTLYALQIAISLFSNAIGFWSSNSHIIPPKASIVFVIFNFSTLSSMNTKTILSFISSILSFKYFSSFSLSSFVPDVFFLVSFLNKLEFFTIINFLSYPKQGVSNSCIRFPIFSSSSSI